MGQKDTALEGNVCFMGNTRGSFLLRPRFKGYIEVEALVYFGLVNKRSSFLMSVHDDEKEFWASDYGVHLMQGRRKKKPKTQRCPKKEFRVTPDRWVDRSKLQELKLVYDPEKKKIEAWLNGRVVNSLTYEDGPTEGRIGFRWKGTRFTVITIEVNGEVDMEWLSRVMEEKRELRPLPPG